MKKFLHVSLSMLLVYGGYWLWTVNERGFQDYAVAWFEDRGLKPPSFYCAMNDKSRAGRCEFDWPQSELPTLEAKLLLKSQPITIESQGCSTEPTFFSSQGILAYTTEKPPGPIFSGNVSTSFLRMYYNKARAKGCIDLHYPYG